MASTSQANPSIRPGLAVRVASTLILAYRYLLSPWVGMHCRFHPSCSHYAEQALAQHGFWRGSWLSLRRLSRCHPWHAGGVDPVPLTDQDGP